MTKTTTIRERVYKYMMMNSYQGRIQVGYNTLAAAVGNGNPGAVHHALNSLINDKEVTVVQDNWGQGSRNARVYGITALLKVFATVS